MGLPQEINITYVIRFLPQEKEYDLTGVVENLFSPELLLMTEVISSYISSHHVAILSPVCK